MGILLKVKFSDRKIKNASGGGALKDAKLSESNLFQKERYKHSEHTTKIAKIT